MRSRDPEELWPQQEDWGRFSILPTYVMRESYEIIFSYLL